MPQRVRMIVPLDQRPRSGPYSGLTINSARRFLANQFRAAALETPDLDARLLIMHAACLSHADMIAQRTDYLPPDVHNLIIKYSERRLAGEPIDHILGYREFYGRRFKITKDVLSPRPETEMLVEAALGILKDNSEATFLDLGTGSGAVAISILAETTNLKGTAIDVSEAALKVTLENAATHEVSDRLTCLQGSWFDPVQDCFDIIISNPPYITKAAMGELETEVKGFDPDLALCGGKDGLTAYRTITSEAANHLKPGGFLIFEIGYDQGQSVSHLLKKANFRDISLSKDLAGHDRMIKAVYSL